MSKKHLEALEDFKMIKFKTINAGYDYGYKVWDKIEQVLLKAQEQEKENQVLKEGIKELLDFMDLEFDDYTINQKRIVDAEIIGTDFSCKVKPESYDKIKKMLKVLENE